MTSKKSADLVPFAVPRETEPLPPSGTAEGRKEVAESAIAFANARAVWDRTCRAVVVLSTSRLIALGTLNSALVVHANQDDPIAATIP